MPVRFYRDSDTPRHLEPQAAARFFIRLDGRAKSPGCLGVVLGRAVTVHLTN
jgi:hypothetical protein